jgi:hypothetical protein
MAQEPLGFRWWGFSPHFARTHSGILTSQRSTSAGFPLSSRRGFHALGTLPYPVRIAPHRPRFGGPLNPDHSRRTHAGLVSYYALFKGVAASKPTSQLSRHAHILRYTQRPLRGLSGGSGFFPSRRRTLSPGDCLPGSVGSLAGRYGHSEFGWGWYGFSPPAPIQSLYLPPTTRSDE